MSEVFVDPGLGSEGATCTLHSRREGVVLVAHMLNRNRNSAYVRDAMLHRLTVDGQECLATSPLAKREITCRVATWALQFHRLIDGTRSTKSVDRMIELAQLLDCDVSVVVRARGA